MTILLLIYVQHYSVRLLHILGIPFFFKKYFFECKRNTGTIRDRWILYLTYNSETLLYRWAHLSLELAEKRSDHLAELLACNFIVHYGWSMVSYTTHRKPTIDRTNVHASWNKGAELYISSTHCATLTIHLYRVRGQSTWPFSGRYLIKYFRVSTLENILLWPHLVMTALWFRATSTSSSYSEIKLHLANDCTRAKD